MTNEDRGAIVELIDDLRSYTHDWDWKYGAFWDAEITRVRSILTALSAGEGTNPPPCPCCGNKETERASWACAQCGYNALAAPAPQEETCERSGTGSEGTSRSVNPQGCTAGSGSAPAANAGTRPTDPAPPASEPAPRCDG